MNDPLVYVTDLKVSDNSTYINVHTNENNETEVSVDDVADKQGREDNPPSRVDVLKQSFTGWTLKHTLHLQKLSQKY